MCDSLLILNELKDLHVAATADLMLFVLFQAFIRCVLLSFLCELTVFICTVCMNT